MTVVRELVNLVSFETDRSSVSAAEKTFTRLAKKAALVGAGLVGAGSRLAVKMEEATAQAKFFGFSSEEVNRIINKQAEGAFSKLEVGQTISQLSELIITSRQVDEAIGFLKDISIARGFTDGLKNVSGFFKAFVEGADLDALKDLAGNNKELVELFKRTDLQSALKLPTQKDRVEFLLKQLRLNADFIKELADEQRKTASFALDETAAAGSDALLKIGKGFEPALIEILKLSTELLTAFEDWEDFWEGFDTLIKGTVKTVKGFSNLLKNVGVLPKTEAEKKQAGGLKVLPGVEETSFGKQLESEQFEKEFPGTIFSTQQGEQAALNANKLEVEISGNIKVGGQEIAPAETRKIVREMLGNTFSVIGSKTGNRSVDFAPAPVN